MARARHAATLDIPSLITAELAPATTAGIADLIDWWVPIVNYMDNDPKNCGGYPPWASGDRRGDYDGLVAAGKRLLWYQSCMSEGCAQVMPPAGDGCRKKDSPCYKGTWPTYMIDAPAPRESQSLTRTAATGCAETKTRLDSWAK